MTISTEYIVVLWLLPVTLFIILPLTVGTGWLAVAAARDIARGRIPFASDRMVQAHNADEGTQKRAEQRHYLSDPVPVQLVDGSRSASGFISNFSRSGLCIEGISEAIETSGEYLKLMVGEAEKLFSLDVEPRWILAGDGGHTSGMKVVGDSSDWQHYVIKA